MLVRDFGDPVTTQWVVDEAGCAMGRLMEPLGREVASGQAKLYEASASCCTELFSRPFNSQRTVAQIPPTHRRTEQKKNELEKLQRSQGALGRTVSAPRRRQRASKSSPCLFRVMLTVSAPPFLPLTCEVLAKLTTHSDSRAEKVLVVTSDSRTLVGMLLSCDQMTNLVFLSVSLFSF